MLSRTLRLSALLIFLTATGCFAQLQRYPLTRTGSAERENPTRAARTQATFLRLPFFDDFSTAAKVPHDSLWLNGGVRINNQFAINAPSKGVATFDGLKDNGQPWDFNPNAVQDTVDMLTSQPIDLSGLTAASNVVLSFFWQAGGLGEAPDPTDSLLVQVKSAANQWRTIHTLKDTTPVVEDFQYVSVPINTADLLHAGFEFRFMAFGRPAGMYDIWNIDYVYLGQNRQLNNPSVRDLAVSGPLKSVLKQYTAMPWDQFNVNPQGETAAYDSTVLSNLERENFNLFKYTYTVADATTGSNLYNFTESAGLQLSAGQKRPVGVPVANNGFTLPQAGGPRRLRATFRITDETTGNVSIPGVNLRRNDTISNVTVLDNYFAYDDGTAEYALGIRQRQGRVAVRYVLNKPAQLTAVRLYLTQLERSLAGQTFVLTVWKRLDRDPASVLYQKSVAVSYTDTLDEFATYPLLDEGNSPTSISLTDTFYVGWQQTTADLLSVGLDANTNNFDQVWYNINGVDWVPNTEVPGSAMIRPVFGSLTTAIEDPEPETPVADPSTLRVFPNPTSGRFTWSIPQVTSVRVMDVMGKVVRTGRYQPSDAPTLDLAGLPDGLYVLHLETPRKNYVRKILLRK
jgi:hypothetical protein